MAQPIMSSLNFLKDLHNNNDNFTRVFVTLSAAVVVVLLIIYFKLRPNRASPPLPPGPRGLPLLGNLLSLEPELHTYFTGLAQIHGPIMKLQLGNKVGIVIASPSMARQVLKDNDVIFANRDVPVSARIATYGGYDITWTPYGAEWRMLRKVSVLKMLSNATLDSVYGLRRREVRKIVGYFYSRVGSPVNVGEQLFLTMLNMVTNMLWGGAAEGDERAGLGAEFRQIVSEMTELIGKPNVSDFYPGLARFDLQGVAKQMNKLVLKFDKIFEDMIAQRLEGSNSKSKDFLQYLLELKEEVDTKTPLTMIHVKALLMDMVVGGSDTTSNTMEFAMAEIMRHPEILKKAQQEIEAVIGKDKTVEESDIHKLPYLHAMMKETLRLHPVLPFLVPHCPSESCTVGGYTIPKGSRVFLNVWAIHRDPSIWENPLKFDPDRFLNNGKWDFSGSDFNYFPFGSGRRICAGIAMAERSVLHLLATLLHSFNWELPQGEKMDVAEKFGIVLKKKIPLVAIPTPRFSNSPLYE